MRYIVSDDQDVSLTLLESALKQIDSSYQIERDDEPDDEGALMHDNKLYGQIEVNRPGDGLFEGEIEELKGFVGSADSEPKTRVLNVLNQATALVVIRVLDQGRESEATLVKIDPLWKWLFANREGLMQAEGEGYYDASGLILEVA